MVLPMVSELFHDIKDKSKDDDEDKGKNKDDDDVGGGEDEDEEGGGKEDDGNVQCPPCIGKLTPVRGDVTTIATTPTTGCTSITTSPAVQSKPNPVTPATRARITNTPSATKNKYPYVTALFGENFDMSNKEIRDNFNSLLAEVVDIAAGDSGEFKVKNCNGNRTFHYLRIPVASSQQAFHNAKHWVNRAIHICCNSVESDNNEPVSASWIANHLCRFYKLSVVEVLEKNELHICHKMSLEVFSAATTAAGLLVSQAKVFAKHLNNHFGKGMCPTHKEMSSLSEGYRESTTGSMKWDYDQGCESNSNSKAKAECITWEVSDYQRMWLPD